MTLTNRRRAVYILLMLPVLALGLAALGVGVARTWGELQGIETAADTVSGLGMIGLSLMPLGSAGLVLFLILRPSQALPPPSADQLAPGAPVAAGRYDFDRIRLQQALGPLGMTLESPAAETRLCISFRDSWSVGPLLLAAAAGLALFVGWPSAQSGHLVLGSVDVVLAAFYLWISLFFVLAAMPISPRRLLVLPSLDALQLEIGRGRRTFGLSRLAALEARVQLSTRRDGETQAVNSKSLRTQLVAWFSADQRGPVPFVLLWGPSAGTYEESDGHLARMETVAEELARGLGVSCGPHALSAGDGAESGIKPYE